MELLSSTNVGTDRSVSFVENIKVGNLVSLYTHGLNTVKESLSQMRFSVLGSKKLIFFNILASTTLTLSASSLGLYQFA